MLELYRNIKDIRLAKKMTQADLAEKAGYTDRSSIARIEKGEIDLPQSKILMIAKALEVDAGDLMGNSGVHFSLSPAEEDLIIAYRNAPEGRQDAVRALLNVKGD